MLRLLEISESTVNHDDQTSGYIATLYLLARWKIYCIALWVPWYWVSCPPKQPYKCLFGHLKWLFLVFTSIVSGPSYITVLKSLIAVTVINPTCVIRKGNKSPTMQMGKCFAVAIEVITKCISATFLCNILSWVLRKEFLLKFCILYIKSSNIAMLHQLAQFSFTTVCFFWSC